MGTPSRGPVRSAPPGETLRVSASMHVRLIDELGLSMLNTLLASPSSLRRRLPVFDERAGMMAGCEDRILEYQDLTTATVRSPTTGVVGVRYRCRPHTLAHAELGAFHTHPVLYSRDLRTIRRRIEQLLWLSDADVHAFLAQHRRFGLRWHFVAALDLGCFHIEDVLRGRRDPRLVLRTPDLARHVRRLAPEIAFYDHVLRVRARSSAPVELLDRVLARVTGLEGDAGTILQALSAEGWQDLGERVLRALLYAGLQHGARARLFERASARLVGMRELESLAREVEEAWNRLTLIRKLP